MCAEREFQLLGEDTQKAREAKDDLTQEGTARRWPLVDRKHLDGSYTYVPLSMRHSAYTLQIVILMWLDCSQCKQVSKFV